MTAPRYFVAECPLCRTKFETEQEGCPVCGSPSLRTIREPVAVAEAIPVPTRRTPPPKAVSLRKRPAPAWGAKAVRPRGADGRFLPGGKAAETTVRRIRVPTPARAMADAAPRLSPSAPKMIRIDVRDAAARLEEARAELRAARRSYFEALRRKSLAEEKVRGIRNAIRRERAAADSTRSGGLFGHLASVVKFFGG